MIGSISGKGASDFQPIKSAVESLLQRKNQQIEIKMSIIYALVAKNTKILSEFAESKGNYTQITNTILDRIPTNQPSKLTYVYDQYLFHYIVADNGLVFLCMADEAFGRRVPFTFLTDVEQDFKRKYCTAANALDFSDMPAYGLNEYSRELQSKMDYYNNDTQSDKIRLVQGEIDQVRDVMVQNIEKVLERGERIEILVDKTDSLNQAAFQFKKRSTVLKRKMWWKNTRVTIILAIIIIIVLYLVIGAGCGYPAWGKCF
jgi:vesicle-associated membrane protein 7